MQRVPNFPSVCGAIAKAGSGVQVIIILALITLLTHGYPWTP